MPVRNRIAQYAKENHTRPYLLADKLNISRSTIGRLSTQLDSIPAQETLESLSDGEFKHPIYFIKYVYPDGTDIDQHLRTVSDYLSRTPGNEGLDRAIAYLKAQKVT